MTTRRSFIRKGTVMAAAAAVAPGIYSIGQEPASQSPLKGKKVLFIWGGWMGHEPEKCRDIFVPWMESEGALVTVSDTLDTYVNMNLRELDLIVQVWTMERRKKHFLKQ